ncbi:MAG: hypothetical protein JWO81_3400 [Alphaproteobacteria bacterium]|nr:hypothetical protein [Alphaproteobacteria bacterium]
MRKLTMAAAALASVMAFAVATPASAQGRDRGEQREWRGRDDHRQRSRAGDEHRRFDRDRRSNRSWNGGYGGYQGYDSFNSYDYGYGRQYDRYDAYRHRHHRRHHRDD